MKRLAKLIISLKVWAATWAWHAVGRLFGRTPPGTCVVLYYHGIAREHRARFARQMNELLRWAQPIAADRRSPLPRGVHHAAVTFDDAFESVADNALPELAERGIPSVLFVPTGVLGRNPDWTMEAECGDGNEVIMRAERLLAIESDLVSLGSHTVTHANLPQLTDQESAAEMTDSKASLEALLGHEVTLFTFPYGEYNAGLIEQARASGYARVFTIEPVMALGRPDEFVTGRVAVEPTDWPLEFRLKLLGAYRWLPKASSLKRRLRAFAGRSFDRDESRPPGLEQEG